MSQQRQICSVVVRADDGDGLERLARYLARPPLSFDRMKWDRESREVVYRTARGHEEGRENAEDRPVGFERLEELEFLARRVTQLPEPLRHSIRYYGYCAAVVRARRRQEKNKAGGRARRRVKKMGGTQAIGLAVSLLSKRKSRIIN